MCFELHSRVALVQFWSAAAISLHRQLAILATSIRPSFSKDTCLGILFFPNVSEIFLRFCFIRFLFQYSNRISPLTSLNRDNAVAPLFSTHG